MVDHPPSLPDDAESDAGDAERARANAVSGAFWIIVSCIGAAVMTISVRIASESLPTPMIVFLRSSLGLAVLAPLLFDGRLFRMKVAKPWMHVVRGLISGSALNLGFYSISSLPLTTSTVLFFLAPVFATALATVFLREKVGIWRWSAVAAAFVGALIIVRPGATPLQLGMVTAILSTLLFATTLIMGRIMSRTDSPTSIFASTIAIGTIATIPPAIPVWTLPEFGLIWLLIGAIVLASSLRMYADIRAYAVAEAGFLAPFTYLRLIFIGSAAWFIFNETPDVWDISGGAVIIIATLVIARREAIKGKKTSRGAL